jgi:hypothetical protein
MRRRSGPPKTLTVWRRLCSFGVVAVTALGVADAEAEEVTARLEWTRDPNAESCMDRERLEAAVNARWRRHVFADGKTDLVVEGKVGRRGRREWVASIEMRRADGKSLGSRELATRAAHCSALDDSVALALGIMLDMSRQRVAEEREQSAVHSAQGEPTEPSTATPAATPSPASTPKSASVGGPPIAIPEETLAPRAPWRFEAVVAGEAALGPLPSLAFGGRVGVAVVPNGFFRVELSASLYESEVLSRRPGARFSVWGGELSGYPLTLGGESMRCELGAAIRLISVHATGLGLDQNGAADEAAIALGPRALAAARIVGPLEVLAGLGAEFPLSRYRFQYRDAGGGAVPVHTTPLISGAVYAGVGLWL